MSYRELRRLLAQHGFQVDRQRGSHAVYLHPDRPTIPITVAGHGNKDVPVGTLRNILKQAGLLDEIRGRT